MDTTLIGVAIAVALAMGVGVWLVVSPGPLKRSAHRPRLLSLKLQGLLEEAGYQHLHLGTVVGVLALGGGVLGVLITLLIPIPVLGLLAGLASWVLGYGFVLRQRRARHHRLRLAWPGVIDHIRAGIRSGGDVVGAVRALPETLPHDIAGPLAEFRIDTDRGMAADEALSELGRRLADPVGDRIVEVLRMAHEVGGTDLPEVLNALARSVRHDIAVREDATAKQSWIRSAAVLAVSAPWVVLVVIGSRAQTVAAYQTFEGTGLLIIGAVVSAVAYRMMHAIGSLPTQRRWVG
jgi:tight adherence protein B